MKKIIELKASSLEEAKKELSTEAARLWWVKYNEEGQLFHPFQGEITITSLWEGATLVATARDLGSREDSFLECYYIA